MSHNIKTRLSDGICPMLGIQPDHVIIPFPSTMVHQTLVTNYGVEGEVHVRERDCEKGNIIRKKRNEGKGEKKMRGRGRT